MQAQFKDSDVVRNNEVISLKRGQIATSYQSLVNDIQAKEITVKVVRSAIKKLIKNGFLEKDESVAKAKKGLLLTIVDYDYYQSPESYKGKESDKVLGISKHVEGQVLGKVKAINNKVNKEKQSKKYDWDTIREEVLLDEKD